MSKRRIIAFLAVALIATSAAHAAESSFPAAVTGHNVRIHSGPHITYREMGTLDKNTLVRVLDVAEDGQWLRIVPPESADVWIFARLVIVAGPLGTVNADRVNVRVRPEINAEEVNQLAKGTLVKIKGSEGDWLKIAPPEGTRAWIIAGHVKRMAEAEVEPWRQQIAREKADEEKRQAEIARKLEEARAEAERKEAEEARKALEARHVADLDRTLAAELARPAAERDLAGPLELYQAAPLKDSELQARVAARIALIQALQDIQAAAAKAAPPPPLPGIDLDKLTAELGSPATAAELRAAHQHALKLAEDAELARRADEEHRKSERTFDGWIRPIGPGLEDTGATHKITSGGRILALVKSSQVQLGPFLGLRLRITGRPVGEALLAPEGKVPLIDVLRAELVSD